MITRVGDAIHFNDQLLNLAGHYRFEPRPVAPYRGSEKGRVERAIRYIRDNFWPARTFTDLADLNAQAAAWCENEAKIRRCPGDRSRTVADAFEEERPRLLPLPQEPFYAEDRVSVVIGKTPYARFDGNDYSVPHDRVRRALTVVASPEQVRILDATEEVARHPRCWGRGRQIENPDHIAALVSDKRKARAARGCDRVLAAVPVAASLLNELAERGANLGAAVAGLGRLLDSYGAGELDVAIREILAADVPNVPAVRQVLDRRRAARNLPPPVPVAVPERVRGLVVRPHDLSAYDQLGGSDV